MYRIVIYADGELSRDEEVHGYILITKPAGEGVRWARVVRGLGDMESLGVHNWAYDEALKESHEEDSESEGLP